MSKPADAAASVPWGLRGALGIGLLALFGADLLGYGIIVGVLQLRGAGGFEAAAEIIRVEQLWLFASYLLARLLGLGMVYAYVRARGGGWKSLGLRRFKPVQGLKVFAAAAVGFVVAGIAAGVLIERFLPSVDLAESQEIGFLNAAGGVELWLAFAALVVIAPFAEELIFRGFLLPALSGPFRVWFGVVLTSLIFGLLHPPLGAQITIGIFGLFLGYAYLRSGSLWPAIALHSGKNLIAFLFLFGVGG